MELFFAPGLFELVSHPRQRSKATVLIYHSVPKRNNFSLASSQMFTATQGETTVQKVWKGSITQWWAYLVPHPAAPGLNPRISKKIQKNFFGCCRGQSAALAIGKLSVAWKCWSQPSSTGWWQASTTKTNRKSRFNPGPLAPQAITLTKASRV